MTSKTSREELRVAADAEAAVLRHARRGAAADPPREVCGVLAGRRRSDESGPSDSDSVSRADPVPNVAPDPRTEYELDPAAAVETIDALEAEGLDVVGFYHSHPESDPHPSPTDEARASWTGYVYLLCHPDGRLNAYRWTGAAFEELRVVQRG
ncbi:metal-dependent protease of the pad1/jab1 superfamily protein [Halogeometricum pallidum JCM 14848]|uniref:Metal-dependent protease of the pad1/jab1 superfamily protein n=1 Tax=Halogeometricum pallidum JCM 14848 TaxID=1227487 RepID=M0DDJ6_HALPD|nr:desampylase [Halogeometricum pallidum]ELZ32822.1 metal-dependent protease of the pad1/jab1 superfamily protein [Halogeometricum pallidum JCM 14848]